MTIYAGDYRLNVKFLGWFRVHPHRNIDQSTLDNFIAENFVARARASHMSVLRLRQIEPRGTMLLPALTSMSQSHSLRSKASGEIQIRDRSNICALCEMAALARSAFPHSHKRRREGKMCRDLISTMMEPVVTIMTE